MLENQTFDKYKVNRWKLSLLPNFFVLIGITSLSLLVFWFFQPIPISTSSASQIAFFSTNPAASVSVSSIQSATSSSSVSVATKNLIQLDLNQILASQSIDNATYYLLKGCAIVTKNQGCSLIQNNKVTGNNTLITDKFFGRAELIAFEGQKFGFAAKQDQESRVNFVIYNNNSSSYNLITFDVETNSVILNQKIDPDDERYTNYLR